MQLGWTNIPHINTNRLFRRFVFALFLILSGFNIFSQDLDKKITVHFENEPLVNVLKEISGRGNIKFSYSSQIVNIENQINYKARNKTIRKVLNEVLLPVNIEWMEMEQQIVLKERRARSQDSSTLNEAAYRYTISGYIREASSGEALIGANVYVPGSTYGVAANSYGFYSLTLPHGTHEVVFSYIGFNQKSKEVSLDDNIVMSVELEQASMGIGEVIVRASDHGKIPGMDQLGDFRISGRTLEKMPGFAGDVDVLKALHALPGIRSFGDGSSLFFVRGGNSDQNLLMIDESPIYNGSHLFGFFSVLSPDAVNEMKVYKGDMPPRYGGRASSVIDITAREGNLKKFGFGGSIGPYATSLYVEGPFVKDKASFIVSARLSNLNWLSNLLADGSSLRISFYDVNAKFNVKVSKRDRLFLTFYSGKDEFGQVRDAVYRTFGISWDNMAGTLRWNHIFSPKLFSNTTLNISNYNYFLYLASNNEDYWKSSIGNIIARSDFSWYINPKNTMRMGISLGQYQSNPGNIFIDDQEEVQGIRHVSEYRSGEFVFYAGNEQLLNDHISLNYGLRLPLWRNYGPTKVYYFDENYVVIDTLNVRENHYYATFFTPEPRISASYDFKDGLSVKAGYTRTTQFLQMLSNGTGPFTSLDVWAPAGPNIEPLKVDQLSAGYFMDFDDDNLHFSVEGYYKWYHNHIDYADHANLLYNPHIEGELRFGRAWSYGVETMLRKKTGRLNGWVAYSWSRALMNTPEINGGNDYPASWDAPHNVNLLLSYDTRRRWSISANWIYSTGNPVTTPTGFIYYDGYSVPVYGKKNNERLPDYHRLDIAIAYRLNKPGNRYRHSLMLTLYNAYGRANPFSVGFNKYMNDNGEFLVPSDTQGSYELVPAMISVAGVIPSVNYKFKF